MKKTLAITALLIVAVAMAGCQSAPAEDESPPLSTETLQEYEQEQRIQRQGICPEGTVLLVEKWGPREEEYYCVVNTGTFM